MKFKGIEVKGTFEVREETRHFEIWKDDKMIYFEGTDGFDFWVKREYDDNGNVTYYENSNGKITDNRPKTKKVFRLWKYLEDESVTLKHKANTIINGCILKFEGKTQEEMINYDLRYVWLVEEEIKWKHTEL